jgi:1-acyl-sn-glycerol-3-phosphate acyltransferase
MPEELPWLWLANHNTWWDGFLLYFLNRRLAGRRMYLLMLEEQLRRFWFFRYLGAYGVRLGEGPDALRLLRYTVELFRERPPALVVWFPQGELVPYGSPVRFARGVEVLLKMAPKPLWVQLVGMYPLLWEHVRPEFFLGFGPGFCLEPGGEVPTSEELAQELEGTLRGLEEAVRGRARFRELFSGRRSPQER